MTVEDAVEYELPAAIQIAVPTTGAGEDRGEHFKRALMHFVRVHPAVGMVSEKGASPELIGVEFPGTRRSAAA